MFSSLTKGVKSQTPKKVIHKSVARFKVDFNDGFGSGDDSFNDFMIQMDDPVV